MSNGFVYDPFRHVMNGQHQSGYTPPPYTLYKWRPELGGLWNQDSANVGEAAPGPVGTGVTGLFFLAAAVGVGWLYATKK